MIPGRALSKATINPDQKMVASLIHENVSYGHTSGQVMNKAEAVKHIVGRKTSVWKWDNPKVTIVGTTAIVRAKQTVDYIDPDTKKIGLSARAVGKDEPIVDTKIYSSEAGGGMASLGELADFGLSKAETGDE